MSKFVVIGAGVIGITNAYEILKQNPQNQVTIISQHFPTDFELKNNYTSPVAGANWSSFAGPNDTFIHEIDKIGYRKFYELLQSRPESGVTARKDVKFVTNEKFIEDGNIKVLPWYSNGEFAKECGFRILDDHEFDKTKFAYGYEYDGFVIRTTYYLTFLLNKCWKLSGVAEGPNARFSIKRSAVKSIKEAFELHSSGYSADFVINCTGLLARELEDIELEERKRIFPVRGVVYVVKNNVGIDKITAVRGIEKGESLYLMPRREGELVIGGCFQIGVEDKTVTDDLKQRIFGRCKKYLPEYNWNDIEIIREQVGFRPFRKDGYRIERVGKIIHCYGMGGAGFQSSWGCAKKVSDLITIYQNRSKF